MDTLRNHKFKKLIIINIIGSIIPYCVFPWLIYLRRWLLFRLTLQSFCFPFGHLFLHLLFLRWHGYGSSPFGSSCPLGCRYSFGLCRGRLHSWALTCSKRDRNAIQTNTNNKESFLVFYRGLLMQWLLYISGSQMGVHVPLGVLQGVRERFIISLSLDIPIISLYFKTKPCVVKGYLAWFVF